MTQIDDAATDLLISMAGSAAPKELGFAYHLAAHAVIEQRFRGTVSHTIDTKAKCPYCDADPADFRPSPDPGSH